MTRNMYICTAGHVDEQPSMGSYASCQIACAVNVNGRNHWYPCGCGMVCVPHDPGLEAAYRVGGQRAVLALLAGAGG